uniref:Uncharacterized protein n=1 Tax=Vannella robusta TaxID=1487602 RepID=A0A7S4IUB1_9EUKA|eukprot:CAMPEP_0206194908 /NCGR_PEP_ID=MMETSP0166-20121206/7498_1 /ASSEMBLY_ACC=CAM_ASM_000260 /TAXON_ID=95228 /ORGANISM="Vannella robusta, Strain DIVA3 518/3/11/1/6" /LENGTH=285 /DNA_ID=CAMNT_0053612013 /DNA_START=21 /DNA_END=878 /DNA_ORIENTATION=+
MALSGQVALVTGASRGVGKGIAIALAKEGALVYMTARSYEENQVEKRLPGSLLSVEHEIKELGGNCRCIQCDHTDDEQTKKVFETIEKEQGKLHILVNNAFAIPKPASEFFHKPFYTQPIHFFDTVTQVGLRNHYVCAVLASKMLIESKGMIINISSAGGQTHLFNTCYGVTKCALDRMAVDMAIDLKPQEVFCISLWPGMVKTERMIMGAALMGGIDKVNEEGESPEFVGRVIAALGSDSDRMSRTGKIWTTRKLASEYNVTDINGKQWPVDEDSEPQNFVKSS